VPFTSFPARAGRDRRALACSLALGAIAAAWPGSAVAQGERARAGADVSAKAGAARTVPDALNYANGLFRDRRYEMAAEEYERFLKSAPPGPDANEARFGLANARLFEGQYAKAREQFEAFLKGAPTDPNAATAIYRVGETSYMLGDLPAARRSLEAFTAKVHDHRYLETAWPYLGEVCLRMHDLPRARQAYERALELHPQGRLAERARFGLGKTLALQGKPDEAVKVLTELTAGKSGDWTDRAWLQIGQAEAGAGRYAQAVEAFQALERAVPKSPLVGEARLGRADALVHLDRREEAETLLRGLVADAPQTLAAQAAFALGTSELEGGRPADAMAFLDESAEKFAATPMGPALIFRAAEAAVKLGKPADARARFLKAAEAGPKHDCADDALVRAARLALEAGDRDDASRLAASFASRFPDSPLRADAHLIEGQVAYDQNRIPQAIAILSRSLAEDRPAPETAHYALYYLGLAYRADGQKAKSDEILESLLKTPAAPAAANAQYLLGQGHFEAKRYAEAIPALEKYLEGQPDGTVAPNALAYIVWSRLELGQVDEASQTMARLAERYPKSETVAPTRLRLAWALLEKERPAEAAAQFAALVEAAPDDKLAPEAALGRGQALAAADKPDEALAAYAGVASKYPDSEQAAQAELARARLLVERERPGEGAGVYAAWVEHYLDAGKAPRGVEPDALLAEWGWALVDAERTAEADRVFGRLLREHPDSPHAADARLILAQSAYDAKDYDQVVSLVAPLVAEEAKTPERLLPSALYLAARARDKRNELDDAAKLLDRLIELDPEGRYRREARFLKADVALKRGDARGAEVEFATLADEPPAKDDPERFGVAVRRGRIQCLMALKMWDHVLKAADDFKAFAPEDPLVAEVDYDRGRALQQLKRFDEARAAYQAVIDARKGGDLAARAQLMRGESYFWQKNYKDALREYFRVATLYDVPVWQAAALLEAGKVYERLDQWAVAAETYEELLSDHPREPSAAEARTRLEAARRHAGNRTPGTETR
jgi:TolA-binding protein